MPSTLLKIRNSCLILFSFSLPISISISNFFVFAACICVLLEWTFKGNFKKILQSKWMISMIILFILFLLGFIMSLSSENAVIVSDSSRLFRISLLLILLPILYTATYSIQFVKSIFWANIISNSFSSLLAILINYGIINHLLKFNLFAEELNYFYFVQINDFKNGAYLNYADHNFFVAVSIVFSVLFFKKIKHNYRLVLVLMSGLLLFSLFTERGIVGILILSLFAVFYNLKLIYNNMFITTIILLIFSSTIYLNSSVVNKVLGQNVIYKTIVFKIKQKENIRLIFFEKTLDLAVQKPLFGYGLGTWRNEYDNYTNSNLNKHRTPHNNYLHIWMELGILGLVSMILIFYYQIIEMMNGNRFIFTVFPVIFLILMFFDNYFISPTGLLLYTLFSLILINVHPFNSSIKS